MFELTDLSPEALRAELDYRRDRLAAVSRRGPRPRPWRRLRERRADPAS